MKRRLIIITSVFVLAAIVFFTWYTYPKQINQTYEGILYQLGPENKDMEEQLTIEVNGEYRKGILRNDSFVGRIQVDGEMLPPDGAMETFLEIEFWERDPLSRGGFIQYINMTDDGYSEIVTYGILFMSNDFSEITIAKHSQEGSGSSWNGEDGLMISAPAKNREEALSIANRLIKDATFD